jgi:hypothetical protein
MRTAEGDIGVDLKNAEEIGWPTLANLIGKRVVTVAGKWLQISTKEQEPQKRINPREQGSVRTDRHRPEQNEPGLQDERPALTPSQWFAERFPSLSTEFGEAILEQTDKHGIVSAEDIGEDFLAATLGDKASPEAPTVFIPTEAKFYTYSPNEGVFIHQRQAVLQTQLSRLLLICARACISEGCNTRTLEFRFRDSASLSGVLRKARGPLEVGHDFFSADSTEFIPCANGMLRLNDKALLPFNPSYRRRNKLAVPFEVTATCPLFVDTLMRPALDQDELDLLQRWCGLALIGENLAQKLLILTGTPGGGKGTFVRVLNGVIGPVKGPLLGRGRRAGVPLAGAPPAIGQANDEPQPVAKRHQPD